jgi:hypothetical protein
VYGEHCCCHCGDDGETTTTTTTTTWILRGDCCWHCVQVAPRDSRPPRANLDRLSDTCVHAAVDRNNSRRCRSCACHYCGPCLQRQSAKQLIVVATTTTTTTAVSSSAAAVPCFAFGRHTFGFCYPEALMRMVYLVYKG